MYIVIVFTYILLYTAFPSALIMAWNLQLDHRKIGRIMANRWSDKSTQLPMAARITILDSFK